MASDKDIIIAARTFNTDISACGIDPQKAHEWIDALVGEVEHARRALKGVIELWDAEHPDDPCGCVGASDDCRHPPPCELCVARLIAEGRTKELFE